MSISMSADKPRTPKIVIVRDRASAGGGIHNYYQALRPHFTVRCQFVDVGCPHRYFASSAPASKWAQCALVRLIIDWWALITKLFRFPDLIHINPGLDMRTRRSLRRDAVSVWLGKLFRRPVIVFWRGWDKGACGRAQFPGGANGILHKTYQMADVHIVLASQFKEDLRRWNFSKPIYVETTVVPDEVIERSPKSRHLAPEETNLLFLSRLEEDKGVFELLDAFRLLQQSRSGNYTLTFAGDGPSLQSLRQRVASLAIQDVRFPGFVTGEKKIECYLQASIFCFLSSHGEGMPNAVLEAMAMGLPLVSSDAGGLKDILCDGETGFIVRPKGNTSRSTSFSLQEVVDHIERLTADSDLYERISAYNKRYAVERFAAKKVAERLESIYRELLGFSWRASDSRTAKVLSKRT